MTDENGLYNPKLSAEPGDIVGEGGDIVAVLGLVAAAAAAQIQGGDGVGGFEMIDLRLEEGVVASIHFIALKSG